MKIINKDEIVKELAEKLLQFDYELRDYHTDVYMYIDEDTHEARLEDFQNPGGRSWKNDNHIHIYTDEPHTGFLIWDSMGAWSDDEICEEFGKTGDEVRAEMRKAQELDEDDEITRRDMEQYIEEKEEYMDAINASYKERLRAFYSDYEAKAWELIEAACKD